MSDYVDSGGYNCIRSVCSKTKPCGDYTECTDSLEQVARVSHSVFCGSFGCEEAGETWELSCGHEVMTESGCDHPEYCIECGTKVVTQ